MLLLDEPRERRSKIRLKAPDVTRAVRKSLDQAGLKDVSVTQDRDLGVVTLRGHVASDDGKEQAAMLAQAVAGQQTIANQIMVTPPGRESQAKSINSDLDSGIEKDLDAALIQHGVRKTVKYDVNGSVVTLRGHVNSEARRTEVARIASGVPNVKQVVNELQLTHRRATTTN